ncbi:MAG: Stp1/IreP family PP2C-type Ser/Thr phosphatase [Zoogloeaceae bacterium]|nr:Stp1/IreP family PP2C-type Ser/Thr phosphatase [Zoogloeaceae bacterium]
MVVKTHPGMVRSHNEDSVFGNPNCGLVILADGMGGYNAGEVASGMATTVLSSELEQAFAVNPPEQLGENGEGCAHTAIREQVARANLAIYNAAESQPQYAGMGTTLVLGLFYDNRLTVAHIGDSRLYRLRDGVIESLTRDHSLLQEQIDAGMISVEEARHSQNKNLVTRAVGVDPEVEVELHDYDTAPGDIYLLCSDGLNDMVEDEEISMTLQVLGANLELAATQLIEMANDNGGRDNVSVILVKVLQEFPARQDWWRRLFNWFK